MLCVYFIHHDKCHSQYLLLVLGVKKCLNLL